MRINRVFLTGLIMAAAVTASMSSLASQPQNDRDTTITPPPVIEIVPTPTPARSRPAGQGQNPSPTVIEPGRIYEGNLFGDQAEFQLNAELRQFFVLSVTTDDFDAVIDVYDSDGNLVGSDDDSGSGNMPQLFFIAPSSGQFKVVLRGYSDPVEGSYILRVDQSMDSIEFGEPIVVDMDGEKSFMYTFDGVREEVINLIASSNDTIDTTLKLIGPDGSEVGYVDDYTGVDPEFRRLQLSQDGRYIVLHAPYSTSAVGEVSLLLERTEIGRIGADPLQIEVPDSQMKDVFLFPVEQGELYLITVTSETQSSITVEIGDIDVVSQASASFTSGEGGSLFYRAAFTGDARLTLSVSSSFGESAGSVFVSVRAANQ